MLAGFDNDAPRSVREARLRAIAGDLERAVGLGAIDGEVFDTLAGVYRAVGDTARAEQAIKDGLAFDCDEHPDGPSCMRLEAVVPMERKDYESARKKIVSYYTAHSSDVAFLNAAGLDLYQHGDLDGAQQFFSFVIGSPNAALDSRAVARCNLGFVLFDRRMFSDAYQQFLAGVNTGGADCRAGLGVTLYAMSQRDQARVVYQQAVDMDPSYRNPDVMRRCNVWSKPARELAIALANELRVMAGGHQM
jgi:Tfp pilus assembly protein PilF